MKIGDISPLGALISGKGALADVSRGGGFGLLPYLATKGRGEDEKKVTVLEEEKPKRRMRGRGRGMNRPGMKRGGSVKKMAKGGSASKRGDGCAQRGKTKCKII